MSFRLPPPVWMLAAGAAQRLLPGRAPTRSTDTVAGALVAASAGLLAATGSRFHAQHTTVHPLHPEHASSLVTTGPNSLTRNPMYVAMAGALVAHAVRRRSFAALLPVAAFVAVIDRTQVAAEERALRAAFGDEYAAYCARVPRWIGPL